VVKGSTARVDNNSRVVIGGNNLAPIYGNEPSAPALGIKVELWDEDSHPITPREKG
jgi:hypothetical protein